MKSFGRSALVVSAVALVAAATALAAGPKKSESAQYTVASGGVPGVTTGFVLRPGETVTVTATGTVCAGLACVGPDGNRMWNTTTSGLLGFVAPGKPAWGLVGRVGSGPWVQIGSGPTPLNGTGVVEFAVNDDWFVDNDGTFEATIWYTCWPGWGYGDKNHRHCGPPGLASGPGSDSRGSGHASGRTGGDSSSAAGSSNAPNAHANANATDNGSSNGPNVHANANATDNGNRGPKR
jgi:hypothetical protein